MAITDKLTPTYNAANPNVARVTATRTPGATTISCDNLAGWPVGGTDQEPVHFSTYQIDTNNNLIAGTQTDWKGIVTGTSIGSIVRTAGAADSGNEVGDVVEMNPTASWAQDLHDWGAAHADKDGALLPAAVQTALGLGSDALNGWNPLTGTFSVATGYNKGNKEYVIDTTVDQTSILSPGMKFKINRSTTPPTQQGDFESSSSQSASRTSASVSGIVFTDDYSLEACIKLESYPGANAMSIVARGTTTNGFFLDIGLAGQVRIYGYNGGVYEGYESSCSVPTGEPVHIAATLDLSGNASTIYINGASVPIRVIAAGGSISAITQAGDLYIGRGPAGTEFFDGNISDVRIWNTIRTATQIRDNMNQQLTGSESGLVAYFKLDGNFNDSTSNANHLTPNNGASATASGNYMNSTEYGIITKVTSTQITVFTGTDYNIPNGAMVNPFYSTQAVPAGFPAAKNKWQVKFIIRNSHVQNSPINNTWYNLTTISGTSGGQVISVPTGEFICGYDISHQCGQADTDSDVFSTLSTANNTESDRDMTTWTYVAAAATSSGGIGHGAKSKLFNMAAQTPLYLNQKTTANSTNINVRGDVAGCLIFAQCAYV